MPADESLGPQPAIAGQHAPAPPDPTASDSANRAPDQNAQAAKGDVADDATAASIDKPLLVDAAELARLLKVSVRTLDRQLAAKLLPAPLLISRRVRRWRRSEIEQWIEAGAPCRREWERMRTSKSPETKC